MNASSNAQGHPSGLFLVPRETKLPTPVRKPARLFVISRPARGPKPPSAWRELRRLLRAILDRLEGH